VLPQRTKRLSDPPWSRSQHRITQLSDIIRRLTVYGANRRRSRVSGGAYPLGVDDDDDRGSWITATDETFADKRASPCRLGTTNGAVVVDSEFCERRDAISIRPRRRPSIDPMLLMVGIG